MENKVVILGCGSSAGVPAPSLEPGGDWGHCNPNVAQNRRTRPSVYVEYNGARILIDVSPDFRAQYLRSYLSGLDAVILTHAHADHISGIDDLRQIYFNQNRQPIPIYATKETFKEVKGTYGYLFENNKKMSIYPKVLDEHIISGNFDVGGRQIEVTRQPHGEVTSLGLRFGSFAYSTDFKELPDKALDKLKNLDLWVTDCVVAGKPRPTHSHLEQTLEYIERIKPNRSVLTHMGKYLDYNELKQSLPTGVVPGYDGMVLEF